MSYCRMSSESNVYVYSTGDDLVCFGCRLAEGQPHFATAKRSVMIEHLREHQSRGHKVPEKSFARLERELREVGDSVEASDLY